VEKMEQPPSIEKIEFNKALIHLLKRPPPKDDKK